MKHIKNYHTHMKVVLFILAMIAVSLSFSSQATVMQSRTVNVGTVDGITGQNTFVPVTLNSLGNENKVQFTLTFDPAILSAPNVTLGTGATGATLTTTPGVGSLAITVDFDDPTTFVTGVQSLVSVRFLVAGGAPAGPTPVTISDIIINDGALTADGTSGAVNVVIPNPTPTLTGLNPSSAPAGAPGFNLSITGTNFITTSTVRWNGSSRNTTFISSTQLLAVIPATDIDTIGTASVTVSTPAPGGGITAPRTFTIGNGVPAITTISPSSGTVGSGDLAITVNGTGFLSTSVVRFNGADLATSFVNDTQLTATIPASNFAATGTASITVFSAPPGGGSSGSVAFPINNAVPVIATLSPSSAAVTGPAFTLTVNGTGFVDGSTVQWNGSDRTTIFVSGTRLTASITATDIAVRGTASVTVVTPAPGGGTSNAASFAVGDPAQAPTLTGLNPRAAVAGGPAFVLIVSGTNFNSSSVVRWNDTDRPTTFVSATQITAAIPATDIATVGTASVKVFTPAPGGGTSNALTFVIANSIFTSVSAASYLGPDIARGAIVAGFGLDLATAQASANTIPLPITLGGSKVTVTDILGMERDAGMYFARADQINYQIPEDTAVGQALVKVTSSDGKISAGSIEVGNMVPGLFSANSTGSEAAAAVILRVKADNTQVFESMVQLNSSTGKYVASPVDLGAAAEQVFLVLYGTGFRNNSGLSAVTATLGGTASQLINYAGLQKDFVGLDQCNVLIPRALIGRGEIDILLTLDGKTANKVTLNVK